VKGLGGGRRLPPAGITVFAMSRSLAPRFPRARDGYRIPELETRSAMKITPPKSAPYHRSPPPPAAPAGSGPNPSDVESLARAVWLREGARPGREDRCREEVDCQLWLTRYLAPADRTAS